VLAAAALDPRHARARLQAGTVVDFIPAHMQLALKAPAVRDGWTGDSANDGRRQM
jgi:hypothetical protein